MQAASPSNARQRPTSPIRTRKNVPIPGFFRSPLKPKPRPIEQLSVRELHDLYDRNARVLSQPAPSTSTYVPRLQAEQARIEAQLLEKEGIDSIQRSLKQAKIVGEDDMNVDVPPTPPLGDTVETKRRIINKFTNPEANAAGPLKVGAFSFQEAVRLEQEAHALERERKQRIEEKRRRMGIPLEGEMLSKQEREARIWAFMNYKPTDSDLEDEEDDEEDDDFANWFEDDQDDGRKGQDIVEPDAEELTDIIRVDPSSPRVRYSTFYEPRDED
ncbi:hypothetical protein EWM64_g1408 [Hericium alpestre]|uniref:Uncharacterized protein n=1 Tax=Hericium alpestre TaxID=135208 RepID=A0A4Z0A6D0_9AGAM|nr:hypothetical protein EWM64_g1408 [Hericium alpestre]